MDEIGDEKKDLPAFIRSKEINNIFNGVQNCIPNLEFSSDSDESNDEIELVVSRKNTSKPLESPPTHQEIAHQAVVPVDVDSRVAEHHIKDLSIHSYIDTLVGQITDAQPSNLEGLEFSLEDDVGDLDLEEMINLLTEQPVSSGTVANEEYDSDSSCSTIVMEQLERLAKTYTIDTSNQSHNNPEDNFVSEMPVSKSPLTTTASTTTTTAAATTEPETVRLDLRTPTPEPGTKASPGRRKTPHVMVKKLQRLSSSDSDSEEERKEWLRLRKKIRAPQVLATPTTDDVALKHANNHGSRATVGGDHPDVCEEDDEKENLNNNKNLQNDSTDFIVSKNVRVAWNGSVDKAEMLNSNFNGTLNMGPFNNKLSNYNENKLPLICSDSTKRDQQEKSEITGGVPVIPKDVSHIYDNDNNSTPVLIKDNDEAKKAREMRQMLAREREKKLLFGSKLEGYVDKNATLIYDVEGSFENLILNTEPSLNQNQKLFQIQFDIDDKGDLKSPPPEYYAFSYADIPTISFYGVEGVLTWLLKSRAFHVIRALMTLINGSLSIVCLVNSDRDLVKLFSTSTIAKCDPNLFSDTLLNDRDYPFCERIHKIVHVARYTKKNDDVFSRPPSLSTSVLTSSTGTDSPANIGSKSSKYRVPCSEVHDRIQPLTPVQFVFTSFPLSLTEPSIFLILSAIRDTQLEIAGLKLVDIPSESEEEASTQRVCLVLSGNDAISRWSEKLGPSDMVIAERTDPDCVRCLVHSVEERISPQTTTTATTAAAGADDRNTEYTGVTVMAGVGGNSWSNDKNQVPCISHTRSTEKTRENVARYFGYQFRDASCKLDMNNKVTMPLVFQRSPEYFFLLMSPMISPSLLGEILQVIQSNGISLLGIRRCRLNYRKCIGIGLSELQTKIFSKFNGTPISSPSLSSSNGSTPSEYDRSNNNPPTFNTDMRGTQPTLASTILFLTKRNGLYHSRVLIHELKDRVIDGHVSHLLNDITSDSFVPVQQMSDPFLYFEVIPYSENNLWNVGGQFGLMPERKTFDFFMAHKTDVVSERRDLEQMVCVALVGQDIVNRAGDELCELVHYGQTLGLTNEYDRGHLELVGVKVISKLSSSQAKELTQYEVGDAKWKSSIQYLQNVPMFAVLFRAINAFVIIKDLLARKKPKKGALCSERIMSENPEQAYKLASLLFFEKELFSDEVMRPKQPHLPPPRTHVNSILGRESRNNIVHVPERLVYQTEGILKSMISPPRLIASVMVTDEVRNCGKIMKRLEQEDFTITGLYLDRSDQLVFCVQSENGIYKLSQLVGPADLKQARKHHQFSLRACYSTSNDSFYCSPTYCDSVSDIKTYFNSGLPCDNTLDLQAEGIPYHYVDGSVSVEAQKQRSYISNPTNLKPLLQTVCVIFPPDLLKPTKHTRLSPTSEIITLMQSCGFELVNIKLCIIQTAQILSLKQLFAKSYPQQMLDTFVDRPCLILALERENAVSCFQQILEGYSNNHQKKLLQTYSHMMLVSQNKSQAALQLTFAFDYLSGRANDAITC